jgi:hypothetical protein
MPLALLLVLAITCAAPLVAGAGTAGVAAGIAAGAAPGVGGSGGDAGSGPGASVVEVEVMPLPPPPPQAPTTNADIMPAMRNLFEFHTPCSLLEFRHSCSAAGGAAECNRVNRHKTIAKPRMRPTVVTIPLFLKRGIGDRA